MLILPSLAQCPVANLNIPSTMVTLSTGSIAGGDKVNVTCKFEDKNRAFFPVDPSIGIVGNNSDNLWSIPCDNSTKNFSMPIPSKVPKCKCIVASAIGQYSSVIEAKNFTSHPLEGLNPLNVGEMVTFQCKDGEAEVDDTKSNQRKSAELF